jgi:hypothetical protein
VAGAAAPGVSSKGSDRVNRGAASVQNAERLHKQHNDADRDQKPRQEYTLPHGLPCRLLVDARTYS